MLILLPPSEGKAVPPDGPPLDPDSLLFPEALGPPRRELVAALIGLCSGPPAEAVATLGITARQEGEVERNTQILTAPTGPAINVYTGVLYDRLGFATLSPAATERAAKHLLIASGLWGMLRPDDRIPYYRFSMKPKLPGIGGLAGFWRPHLAAAMAEAGHDRDGGLILDLRSGAYAAAWKPKRARLLPVRVFTERNGARKVVSHMAKATRGDVARILLESGTLPDSPGGVAEILGSAGMWVELNAGSLDVIAAA